MTLSCPRVVTANYAHKLFVTWTDLGLGIRWSPWIVPGLDPGSWRPQDGNRTKWP